jgi:plasmid stability protein
MPDYTLKNIPEDLYHRLQSAAAEQFRSVNQEVLFRLSQSFDAQEAQMSALHARWIHEALASGETTTLTPSELDQAFERGVARAKARKQAHSNAA